MKNEDRLALKLRKTAGAGVYHLPAEGCGALAAAAASAGFAVARVDLDDCGDKAEFLRRVAAALRFPTWFGHNWDALADCLADMSWWPADGHVLILEHADRFRGAAEEDFNMALDILEDAARERAADEMPFWTFVGLTADGIVRLRSL